MLAIYSIGTATNALMWVTFSPVADFSSSYFDVNLTAINCLGLAFLALYLPGSILAASVANGCGLRAAITAGSVLTCVGAAIRFGGVAIVSLGKAPPRTGFAVVLIGQSLAALGQPFFTNTPARLAGEWFGLKTRDIATAIGALFNPLGNAVGQILPSVLVSCGATSCVTSEVRGMMALMGIQLGIACVASLWTVLFLRSEPQIPPSASAAEHRKMRREAATLGVGRSTVEQARAAVARIGTDLRALLRNVEFLKLLFGFGIGLALFNALVTVLEQLVQPVFCNPDGGWEGGRKDRAQLAAGIYGATLIVAGLVGACIVGPLLDVTHAYKTALKTCLVGGCAALILLVFLLQPGLEIEIGVAFALMGFFMLPSLPAALEAAVEVTYPIVEESSTALLLLFGNTLGISITFGMQALIKLRPCWHTAPEPLGLRQLTPVSYLMFGVMAIALIIVLLFYPKYKRLEAERAKADGALGTIEESAKKGAATRLLE